MHSVSELRLQRVKRIRPAVYRQCQMQGQGNWLPADRRAGIHLEYWCIRRPKAAERRDTAESHKQRSV